ncbi:unnamed protein product, partial [Nesidiocoris tenuis]
MFQNVSSPSAHRLLVLSNDVPLPYGLPLRPGRPRAAPGDLRQGRPRWRDSGQRDGHHDR